MHYFVLSRIDEAQVQSGRPSLYLFHSQFSLSPSFCFFFFSWSFSLSLKHILMSSCRCCQICFTSFQCKTVVTLHPIHLQCIISNAQIELIKKPTLHHIQIFSTIIFFPSLPPPVSTSSGRFPVLITASDMLTSECQIAKDFTFLFIVHVIYFLLK